MTLPPALLYWIVIHPLAKFWRTRSPWITYGVVAIMAITVGVVTFAVRDAVIGRDLGTVWGLVAVGAVLYAVAIGLTGLARRHLKLSILVGLPEVSEAAYPGKLLDQGIYGRIRHPRYASVLVGTAGYALITNYTGVYWMALLTLPALWLVIRLEERELIKRFGATYREYRTRVPALVPRKGG